MTEPAPLLELQHLRKTFRSQAGPFSKRRETLAVDDVSLVLRPGRTLALVGESGSGKSTVARLATRLIDPDEGRVVFQGTDITRLSQRRLRPLRRDIAMVFQDPYTSLNPRHRVGQIVGRVLQHHGLPAGHDEVAALLERVGLDPAFANRYPHEFSGGQRQRIGIARALATGPKVLVADEPVSALDVSVRAQVLNLLTDLRDERQLGLLLISHDLSVVRAVADEVAVMHHGRIVEQGPVDEVYEHPKDEYTQGLLAAVPVSDPRQRRRPVRGRKQPTGV